MINIKKIYMFGLGLIICFWLINGALPLNAAEETTSVCQTCSEGADKNDHTHSDQPEHDHEDNEVVIDEHIGHNHELEESDEHAGHDHESDEGNEHEEGVVHLSLEEQNFIGIEVVPAEKGEIPTSIKLTGQVHLNDDRLAHISALTPGIVRDVIKSIGDSVQAGDVLAWIESVELGQAKVEYLDILAEIGCCKTLLDRAKNLHDNTMKMIALLKTEPTLDEIKSFEPLEMGDNRSKLVKAYSEVILAESVYVREKELFEQKISSKQEFLDAENALKKAEAEYISVMDIIKFQIKQNLLEETTNRQRADIALRGAERKLYILGQSKEDIEKLVVPGQTAPNGVNVGACPDPNCEQCKKKSMMAEKQNELNFKRLGWYPLKAPFDATIIEKHITLGEQLSSDRAAFTIADLDTVWVDLDVYPKDLANVKAGQKCLIIANGKGFQGELSFVSPVLDAKSRTATARVVVDNSGNVLRPGQFVTATVYGKASQAGIVLPDNAVQFVDGRSVVFIFDGEDFEMKPVVIGLRESGKVEILSGIDVGQKVVVKGAFDLKAKIVTSTLDSHAGHGH